MCTNCKDGICQQKCVAGQQRGYRGEIIPSEAILFSQKTDEVAPDANDKTHPYRRPNDKDIRHD